MTDLELVDVAEAARLTGLHVQTLYRLARQRRIRSFKVLGSAVRFAKTDLQALVVAQDPTPAQRAPERQR